MEMPPFSGWHSVLSKKGAFLMNSLENFVKIGTFLRPHGIAGTLVLAFEQEWEEAVENARVMLVETDGLPVPWFVTSDGIRIITSQTALVDLEWIDDHQAAKKLCGNPVYLEKSPTFAMSDPGPVELTGYSLLDTGGQVIGNIAGLEDYAGNIVLLIETGSGEKLVPYHPDFVRNIDKTGKKLTLQLPEGLLDI
jgi:16S rRNA processing protein RimM